MDRDTDRLMGHTRENRTLPENASQIDRAWTVRDLLTQRLEDLRAHLVTSAADGGAEVYTQMFGET